MLEHSNYNLFQGRSCWHVARRAQPTERPDVDHQGRWCNSLTLASVDNLYEGAEVRIAGNRVVPAG